jgi:hypothetical protein
MSLAWHFVDVSLGAITLYIEAFQPAAVLQMVIKTQEVPLPFSCPTSYGPRSRCCSWSIDHSSTPNCVAAVSTDRCGVWLACAGIVLRHPNAATLNHSCVPSWQLERQQGQRHQVE